MEISGSDSQGHGPHRSVSADMSTKVQAEAVSYRSSVMKGGALLFGRQIVSVVLKFIGVLLIARILGPTKYGAFVAAFNLYQYAIALGQLGIGVFLLRHAGELGERYIGTSYVILIAMSVALVVGAEAGRDVLSGFVKVEGFSQVMGVMILAAPLQLLTVPALIPLERALNYRAVALTEITGQVGYYFIAIPFVLLNRSPVALAFAWIIQQAGTLVLAHYYARRWPILRWDGAAAQEMLRYTTSFSFANWIWQLRMLVNPLIVGPALGAYAVGIIGMAVGILEMLGILRTIAWRISLAVLARFQDDLPRIRKAISEGMELQLLATGSIVLGFAWFGRWIIPMIFGARWLPVLEIYPYIAVSYLTAAMFNMHTATMSVLFRNMRLAIFHAVHILCFAGTAYLTVPHVGMKGYGFGELAGIPPYLILHVLIARAVGSPDYRLAGLWWVATVIGLFWRELGPWAIAAPFAALLLPISLRKLSAYYKMAGAQGGSLIARRTAGGGRTIFLMSCSDSETGFRRPFAQALHELGNKVYYIQVRRRPIITLIGEERPRSVSIVGFVIWMTKQCRTAPQPLIFNSTNLVFPRLTRILKILCGGLWCLDMHDDLLYDKTGEELARARRAQEDLVRSADFIVHSAPTLAELFPQSRHLGNASDLKPVAPAVFDASRVLILASLDQRFDFDLLEAVARLNPQIQFVIWGRLTKTPLIAERLEQVQKKSPNVVYRGPYKNADIVRLASEYSMTFAPYRANTRLTHYLDPLRYYHCLNAGMEVVTTDIPQARHLAQRLHIIDAPEQFATLVTDLVTKPQCRRNIDAGAHLETWHARAEKLMDIVASVEAERAAAKA